MAEERTRRDPAVTLIWGAAVVALVVVMVGAFGDGNPGLGVLALVGLAVLVTLRR